MNKTTIICLFSFVFVMTAAHAFPQSYEFDFNDDSVWDTEWTLNPPPSAGTVNLDVWLDNYSCTPDDLLLGAELYFYYDPTRITVNESNSYPNTSNHGGPFDPDLSFFNYLENGVYALTVSQLSPPTTVTDNKIKLATIELECVAEGDAVIKAANNIGFGDYTDGFIADCNLDIQYPVDAEATVHQAWPPCTLAIGSGPGYYVQSVYPGPIVVGPPCSATFSGDCATPEVTFSDDCTYADVDPDTGMLTVYASPYDEPCHVFAEDTANPDACSEPGADCMIDLTIGFG